jgi:para-nitrobenzyl esterase
MSVGTLLASPKAKGLFHKAIPQSGAAHTSHTPDNATLVARKFLELSGVKAGDIEALRALTPDQIVAASERLGVAVATAAAEGFSGSGLPFQPAIGDDVVPVAPIDALRSGAATTIATIAGTNRDEWNLFAAGPRENDAVERAQRPLKATFERAGHPMDEVVGLYRKSLGEGSDAQVRNALETDRSFRIPAIRLAEAQVANGAPTWMYRFDWPTPAFDGRLGACHILEIPFMFDNLEAPGANYYTGGVAPQELATKMHAAWVNFAKDGDPGWTQYDMNNRPTMVFNEESSVEDDPGGDTRLLWEGVL